MPLRTPPLPADDTVEEPLDHVWDDLGECKHNDGRTYRDEEVGGVGLKILHELIEDLLTKPDNQLHYEELGADAHGINQDL